MILTAVCVVLDHPARWFFGGLATSAGLIALAWWAGRPDREETSR